MKIAAVVILFHPSQSLISNINTYYNNVDKIFVFDNTETESIFQRELEQRQKIEFVHDYNNAGIANRLNSAVNKAIQQGFDWLLTMDQDSHFAADTISEYFNCHSKYEPKENVALFGTRYDRQKNTTQRGCMPTEIHELITSGTLVNLALYKKIGPFDEALFIDSVDHDYCIRAILSGFSLIEFSNIYLSHQLGTITYRSSIKSFFLIKKSKKIYSPVRCYYMYRNLLYLEKKYQNQNVTLCTSIRQTAISNIRNSILYGRNTIKIIRYLVLARKDYKKRNMGKIKREL